MVLVLSATTTVTACDKCCTCKPDPKPPEPIVIQTTVKVVAKVFYHHKVLATDVIVYYIVFEKGNERRFIQVTRSDWLRIDYNNEVLLSVDEWNNGLRT
jgi:hypothetical protein